MTRERTLPALEAAHIKPYNDSGPHDVRNGLLLRSDIHKLFDTGYVTISRIIILKSADALKKNSKMDATTMLCMANRFYYLGVSLIGLTAIMFPGTMRKFSETDLIQLLK